MDEISAVAPPLPTRAIMAQRWRWVSFLHWRVESASIAHLFPEGTRPDEFDGSSWVGLIAFHLSDFSLFGGPPVPYFGSFPEINVRLYSVDGRGRRGVVFLSLEATRLVTVLGANVALKVPYKWARMSMWVDRTMDYRSRRLTDSRPSSHIVTRPSAETVERDPLADFLTARWGMPRAGECTVEYWEAPASCRTSMSRGRCAAPSWSNSTTSYWMPPASPESRPELRTRCSTRRE